MYNKKKGNNTAIPNSALNVLSSKTFILNSIKNSTQECHLALGVGFFHGYPTQSLLKKYYRTYISDVLQANPRYTTFKVIKIVFKGFVVKGTMANTTKSLIGVPQVCGKKCHWDGKLYDLPKLYNLPISAKK